MNPVRLRTVALGLALLTVSCGPPEPAPLSPTTFAFGVFGDGPYRSWERGRFTRLIADANRTDLQWFLHVGDLLWFPCSDAALTERRAALNSIRHPVVYTPGDNEWTDCHEPIAGGFQPLDRLRSIRKIFFAEPGLSIGGRPMRMESQSEDSAWGEFVENVRWKFGGFVFVTIHMVGSGNASHPFPGRSSADDEEVVRRTAAALAWLDSAFSVARTDSLSGVVVAIHGDPGFEEGPGGYTGYATFLDRLRQRALGFQGPILLIHGDTHEFRVDHPLEHPETGAMLIHLTRLETFGSPDIGWVRVVVDTIAGRIVAYEPRRMPSRLIW